MKERIDKLSSVQSLRPIRLFATPWTASCQASLPIINSQIFTQTHVHWVSDAIQPSHSLLATSPPTFNLSQHQSLFKWVSSLHEVDKVSASASLLPMNIQDWFPLGLTSLVSCSPRDSQEYSPTLQFKSINSLALSFLCGPTLTSIHDYWKNNSFDYTELCWQSNVSAF